MQTHVIMIVVVIHAMVDGGSDFRIVGGTVVRVVVIVAVIAMMMSDIRSRRRERSWGASRRWGDRCFRHTTITMTSAVRTTCNRS